MSGAGSRARREEAVTPVETRARRIRFDRNELSGAFGDIGTDFPLIVGMILAANLRPANVLVMFGAMQILTGILYGIPMPAQPLKAMATIVITQKLSGNILYGGGLAIGVVMLVLIAFGLLDALARAIPRVVVRGIQFGLGLQLASLALKEYLAAEGMAGYVLGALTFVFVIALLGNRRYPPAPFAIVFGIVFAVLFRIDAHRIISGFGFTLPAFRVPSHADVWTGFLMLALPQIPLSLGNSLLATRQIAADLFPERQITIRKIGFTYAVMNLVNPFFGGVPTCHGSGGMAGHYTFGGRTGGSVVLYGLLYLLVGLFLSAAFGDVVLLFPKPVLGVILFVEALALMALVRDTAATKSDFSLVLLVGLLAVSLPYGYLVALLVGAPLAHLAKRGRTGLAEEISRS
jgi:hypothetical protein